MCWISVCDEQDLLENGGVCVLIEGKQIALFGVNKNVYAISNYDPIGKANVLSRGIVGSYKNHLVVASPLYKQHFSLTTGICQEDEHYVLPIYASEIRDGRVWLEMKTMEQIGEIE